MIGLAKHRGSTAERALGVNQVCWIIGGTARTVVTSLVR